MKVTQPFQILLRSLKAIVDSFKDGEEKFKINELQSGGILPSELVMSHLQLRSHIR